MEPAVRDVVVTLAVMAVVSREMLPAALLATVVPVETMDPPVKAPVVVTVGNVDPDDLPVTTPAEALEHANHRAPMHLLGEVVGAGAT